MNTKDPDPKYYENAGSVNNVYGSATLRRTVPSECGETNEWNYLPEFVVATTTRRFLSALLFVLTF